MAEQQSSTHYQLNVIVPVHNEERNLSAFFEALNVAMQSVDLSWQVTFVDDGSIDDSHTELELIAAENPHVSIIVLSRNFGKEAALSAGLQTSTADAVIMMDADLQHPPSYIGELVAKWRRGAQVVIGVRESTANESVIKRFGSKLFYAIINRVSRTYIMPNATDFRLLDREVVEAFSALPERNRITRGLIDWLGYERTYVMFQVADRHSGQATYSIGKLFQLAVNSFVSMTMLPLRISVYLGFAILTVFSPLGLFMLFSRFALNDRYDFSGPATLAVLIILLVGLILINIGFVGIYIANIQDQVRKRPLYLINKKYSRQSSGYDVALKEKITMTASPPLQGKKIVWLSWKDVDHPQAGGAEQVQHQLCTRLAEDGYQVTVITSQPKGLERSTNKYGYTVERRGNRYSVYLKAWRHYRARHRHTTDILVEEINTVPFFSRWYRGKQAQSVLFFHQLAREIWFHEYIPGINLIGYLLEPLSLRFAGARGRFTDKVITVSESTRRDLAEHGFDPRRVSVISEGSTVAPVEDPTHVYKLPAPSILAYGSVRSMKRTIHVIHAFEQAKERIPKLSLTIAGSTQGSYGKRVRQVVAKSQYAKDITLTGRVDSADTAALLGCHHFLISTAVKEGWGLTITEAAGQGTPAIVYDVDGQRDAVFQGAAGLLVPAGDIDVLGMTIVQALSPSFDYARLQRDAWLHAQAVTFDNSYRDFKQTLL